MAIKNTLSISKNYPLIILSFFLFACQHDPVRAPQDPTIQMPAPTVVTPPTSSTVGSENVSVPDFVGKRAPHVGLILGPGGAKSWAHIGVLQELEKRKIPISAVVGLEWAALVGALYAAHGQAHEVDWKISQFPQLSSTSKGLFSQKYGAIQDKELNPYLKKITSEGRLEQTRIPFACPYIRGSSGRVSLASKGLVSVALRSCLPYPPQFTLAENMAAPFAMSEAVDYLKSQGAELIILVNVLESVDKKLFADWSESEWSWFAWLPVFHALKTAKHQGVHEIITIDTSTYKMSDIGQRLRLIQLGKQATAGAIENVAQKYGY